MKPTQRRIWPVFRLALTVALVASFALLWTARAQPPDRLVIVSPQEPATLLPHFDLLTLTHEVQRLAFDCLLTLDEEGEYVPQLAREVPSTENGGISPDGRVYTFRLRDGVRWHDGEPLTAADVKFTWEVITNPDLPVPSRAVWEDIARIETPDPLTVEVHFPETNVGFLATAATDSCFVLPEHALAGTDIVNSPLNRQPIGTGPFVVERWAAGEFVSLRANPDYRVPGQPAIDEVTVRFVPGTAGQRAALERGETDLQLDLTTADLRFVQSLNDYRVVTAPFHAWWQFWINTDDPALSDVAVRRALAHGLDRAAITETVMADLVAPLDAVLPPSHWAHNPDVRTYPFDPERARQLLEEAGWTAGSDGIRERNGQKLKIEILNIAGQAERRQVVQIAQGFWRELGIDATIREIDGAAFPPTMAEGDFQLAYGWFGEKQEPVFNLWVGTNWQRYDNEEAFELLEQVPATVDRAERRALIQRFQELVAEDVPILPLAPRVILNAAHARLEGYAPSLSGSLWNAAAWTLNRP